jgi:hypothetical protein
MASPSGRSRCCFAVLERRQHQATGVVAVTDALESADHRRIRQVGVRPDPLRIGLRRQDAGDLDEDVDRVSMTPALG